MSRSCTLLKHCIRTVKLKCAAVEEHISYLLYQYASCFIYDVYVFIYLFVIYEFGICTGTFR